MKEACGSCIFCHQAFGNEYGRCRRYPKIYNPTLEQFTFPTVNMLHDWCGEYVQSLRDEMNDMYMEMSDRENNEG